MSKSAKHQAYYRHNKKLEIKCGIQRKLIGSDYECFVKKADNLCPKANFQMRNGLSGFR